MAHGLTQRDLRAWRDVNETFRKATRQMDRELWWSSAHARALVGRTFTRLKRQRLKRLPMVPR